jgi:hypothetical protein
LIYELFVFVSSCVELKASPQWQGLLLLLNWFCGVNWDGKVVINPDILTAQIQLTWMGISHLVIWDGEFLVVSDILTAALNSEKWYSLHGYKLPIHDTLLPALND